MAHIKNQREYETHNQIAYCGLLFNNYLGIKERGSKIGVDSLWIIQQFWSESEDHIK